ncbi:MAG: tyrosine-type recombinase/integrase [Gemmatimonadetes bacterium]|nr:tyrosine-type recombinase/integrase [Gemmatimonadota bacterium]MYE95121.1 tyrosine-type recombinase/integrase [Gemmatimonadota bacterium]MYJ10315.1 tyrosine-type recombinase/integrase [Gemmatimonadota bacterium]
MIHHKEGDTVTKRPRTLSAAFVRTVNRPGVYGDGRGGRGLSLRVHRTLDGRITKTWRQRVRIEGRLTSIGLGPYPEVTLAEARQKALDNSRGVLLGQDPRGRGVPTFAEAAERTIELHRKAWKEGSPLPEQWESTFRLHAAPLLDKRVDRIESADVLRCLSPIWNSKPAAARKARHRIAAVFRWCIGRNYRPDNPVDRAVEALPKVNGNTTSHHRALPHAEVGAALRTVRRTTDTHPSAVPCVELIVLAAVRPGEARGARWDEIDMDAAVWTIPASRMKAGREFAVPLSTGALEVLERARKLSGGSPLVFPSRTGGPLPSKAPLRVLRRAGVDSTLHGFRSSARSWMAESGIPAEVAEACLAHVPKSQIVQAYQRSDLLARRAEVMQGWSDYIG